MADPICRWRNSSIKQVLEFNSILPLSIMPKEQARILIDKRWELMGYKDFFTTAYQLATQMGMYYEDEENFYPRFCERINLEEAAEYMHYWGSHYYAPNPYTRSMSKEQRPVIINRFLVNWVLNHDVALFSEALKAMFVDTLGNTDILVNMVNNFLDVEIKNNVMTLKKGVQPTKNEQCYVDFDIDDKKIFFDFIGLNKLSNKSTIVKTFSTRLQQIYYGAPGTGKSYTINAITNQEKSNTIRTTFHPDTDYSSFVGAYKPTTIEEPVMTVIGTKAVPVENADGTPRLESKIVYEFVSQSFLKAYVNAWKLYAKANEANVVKKQYLVIEEINRGNCAQIFGDLFQLLDRNDSGFSDYPIDADADMQKQLCKQFRGLEIPLHSDINKLYEDTGRNIVSEVLQGKILLLPNNFYIWATMNTSDQSLFPIDSAFKRRWDWEYMPISNAEKNWIISVNGNNYDWWEFLQAINELIGATTYSEDKKLGYFFCKAHEGVISAEKFVGKVIFYLWNDVFKDYGFEGEAFTDTDEGGKLTFEKFYKVIHGRETAINENILEMFLKNLKLKPLNKDSDDREDMEDGEIANLSEKDSKSFSLNGKKMNLKDIAKKVVSNYCSLHQEEDAQSIRDLFINKCKGIGISHIVETEQEFALRSDQKSAQRTVNEIKLSNGEKLYVSTQWRAGNPEDNFYKFIKIVHNNNWGKIELVD